ncbi:MAG: hypothetical protein EA342_14015 [Leptolyngbya sp. LCM1.Bin17]|nr:MAG: hypothetical protein EA342_14015 [Leptolyngbya sp. LCM1.Bin17]
MAQRQYTKAIRKLRQALKRDPDLTPSFTEAELWLKQGEYDLEQERYGQAETAYRSALDLGSYGDTHYWIAKCLLAQQKADEALDLFQQAFEDKTLPKEFGGCYLKLLWLNGQADTVDRLVKTQPKRFLAPHLHWARGVLALQAEEPEAALTHFKKMGRPASPGDQADIWSSYAYQCTEDWLAAETALGLGQPSFGGPLFQTRPPQHAAVQALAVVQAAHSQSDPTDLLNPRQLDVSQRDTVLLLELLHLVRQENFHEAAHALLDLSEQTMATYPELQTLHGPLMRLAGDQALKQGEITCTATFWSHAVNQPEFDPQLAVQLYPVLDATGDYHEAQALVQQILAWVQTNAKQRPQLWPDDRLSSTLARLYCWLADNQMATRRFAEGKRSLGKAEKLVPNHPEVIGRKGLEAYQVGKLQEAIERLTQALEGGCQFAEVYQVLLEGLKRKGDKDAIKTVRRKFGKTFGDVGVETEVDMPEWIEALSFQNYELLEDYVEQQPQPTPPVQALQIFLDAAADQPSSSQKITLNQEIAVPQWDQLLRSHPPEAQVDILQAIYWVVQQHARRNKKGIAALQSRYFQQIIELKTTVPAAALAHLMILPLRNVSPERLSMAVNATLNRAAQPGNLLAQAQLRLRIFDDSSRALGPFIAEQLQQDPQNPLLLLAQATLYPFRSLDYQTYYDQGFELARKLQDAEALEAYRQQDWVQSQIMARKVMGNQLNRISSDPSQIDMMNILKRMARETLGVDVPPEVLNQMILEFMGQAGNPFMDDMPFSLDDMIDEEEEDDFFFLPPPGKGRKSSKKRKPWYEL